MKRLFFAIMTLLSLPQIAAATDTLSVKQITDYALRPSRVSGVIPIKGSSKYASIEDEGKRIATYSFKTGQPAGVIFDVADTRGEKIDAVDGYDVSPDGKTLLIETNRQAIYRRSYTADCYLYDVSTKTLTKLSKEGKEQVPTFSPVGNKIAFVRNNNIFLVENGNVRQLTFDGERNKIINGIPDWVSEEELSFNNALAWGPDGQTLSFIRYDESAVKTYDLQMFQGSHPTRKENADYPSAYSYKYPKAGQDNAKLSVHTICLADGTIRQYDLPLDADGYVTRLKTIKQGVAILTLNRHQDLLRIFVGNPTNAICSQLFEEQGDRYIQESALDGIIIGNDYFLLPSDKNDYMGLYLYDISHKNGKASLKETTLSQQDVTEVYGFDERTRTVYYQAVGRTPMDRVICKSTPKGTTFLTKDEGAANATFSGDYKYFLAEESDLNTPPRYTIYDQQGKTVRQVLNNDELAQNLKQYDLVPREFIQFTTSENVVLNGWMVKPANFDAKKKYPVILFQYGGPGSQQVLNSWNAGSMGNGGLYDYYFAQHGYIVVCVDGRGTGGRGAAFEKQTYLKLGELEARDQVETAIWLGNQPEVDKERIGIWGWSFGGFNTLMAMSEGRPVFKAGVAVAPPTNWKFYDTIYTERYMRTPQENPDGYAVNPTVRAEKLHGALLICHGLADDNVHPQNTFEYTEALVQAGKDFKMNIYTNRNHSIYGGKTRQHLLRQIAQWFFDKL